MKAESLTLGQFIRKKRLENQDYLSPLDISKLLEISPTIYCDIEHSKRLPPDSFDYEVLAEILHLNSNEKAQMYDLAAKWEPPISLDSKDAVDIFDIIMNPGNRSVPKGLVWETYRGTANEEKWKRDIRELEKEKREKAKSCASI